MNLLILGASGGCGRWLVRLAYERGHHVRALVRPETPFRAPEGVEVVRGEVLASGVLAEVLDGQGAVLSALGIKRKAPWNPWSRLASPPDLNTRVAQMLAAEMPARGVKRVAVISAAGAGDSSVATHPVIRGMIRVSNLRAAYADLEAMEQTLAASDLDWLAVRPTTLTDGAPTGAAQLARTYGLSTRVPRSEVAAHMLDAVESPEPFTLRTPMLRGKGRR